MTSYPFTILDVFAERPLEGNQLAVFGPDAQVPDLLLQPVAREIGFSETVYMYDPSPGAAADARVRIFTPGTELPFAGHPVLGTAVWTAAERRLSTVRLETGAGIVAVEVDGGFGRMQQPLPTWVPFDDAEALLEVLGVSSSELPVEVYDNGGVRHAYVVLAAADDVAKLAPDSSALVRLAGVMGMNCLAGTGRRWKTRMFVPGAGIIEDPATGSAAGPLAVHLARHGLAPWGEEIEISQGAEIGRPSVLYATARGSDDHVDAVEVGGRAFVVGSGQFNL